MRPHGWIATYYLAKGHYYSWLTGHETNGKSLLYNAKGALCGPGLSINQTLYRSAVFKYRLSIVAGMIAVGVTVWLLMHAPDAASSQAGWGLALLSGLAGSAFLSYSSSLTATLNDIVLRTLDGTRSDLARMYAAADKYLRVPDPWYALDIIGPDDGRQSTRIARKFFESHPSRKEAEELQKLAQQSLLGLSEDAAGSSARPVSWMRLWGPLALIAALVSLAAVGACSLFVCVPWTWALLIVTGAVTVILTGARVILTGYGRSREWLDRHCPWLRP